MRVDVVVAVDRGRVALVAVGGGHEGRLERRPVIGGISVDVDSEYGLSLRSERARGRRRQASEAPVVERADDTGLRIDLHVANQRARATDPG